MTRFSFILAFGLLSACGGTSIPLEVSSGGSGSGSGTTLAPITTDPGPGQDSSFASLLNDVRLDNGAGRVTYNRQLDSAAQSHADDMLDNNYFSHTGLNGSTPWERASAAGYDYRYIGENIASGYQTGESVLTGWVNSPGHQRNNIDPNFEEFGLGFARDGSNTRWVLLLGAR